MRAKIIIRTVFRYIYPQLGKNYGNGMKAATKHNLDKIAWATHLHNIYKTTNSDAEIIRAKPLSQTMHSK